MPCQVLSDIWTIADKDGHGWLSPAQTAVAVRLIGWAQVGVKAAPTLLEKRACSLMRLTTVGVC